MGRREMGRERRRWGKVDSLPCKLTLDLYCEEDTFN